MYTMIMKKCSLGVVVFTLIAFSLTSCKKENPKFVVENDNLVPNSLVIQSLVSPEKKVDIKLLDEYINYKLEAEKIAFFKKEKIAYSSPIAKVSDEEFDKMIDNYLINEANQMARSEKFKNINSSVKREITPTNAVPPGDTTEAQWVAPSEWTLLNSIHMQAIRNSGLTITGQSFSFAGLTGTMASSGYLIQSTHNGVTTYRQNYTHTITYLGINFTEVYTLYGNIYNGQATVNIMARPQSN